MKPIRAVITGTGRCVPEGVLTNADLQRLVSTTDAWIVERTGIHTRHIASSDETTSGLAAEAGRRAMAAANVSATDIGLLIVATVTPDERMPATATRVAHSLGLTCGAFDLGAACAGFVYALEVGRASLLAGTARHVLVIGAELLSRVVDYTDRDTCVLFGDGAGAVVLSAVETDTGTGLSIGRFGTNGALAHLLRLEEAPEGGGHPKVRMQGREVFRQAVVHLSEIIRQVVAEAGFEPESLDWVVPHQANNRLLEAVAKRADVPMSKLVINLDRYGNTSAASIPMALDEALRAGRIEPGHRVLFVALGAGLTWGASTYQA